MNIHSLSWPRGMRGEIGGKGVRRIWTNIKNTALYGRWKAAKWKRRIYTGHSDRCARADGSNIATEASLDARTDIRISVTLR